MDLENTEQIIGLIRKKLSETLSPDEQEELNVWTKQQANKALLEHFYSKDFLKTIIHSDDTHLMSKGWKRVEQLTFRQKQLSLFKRLAVCAAVVIPVLLVSVLWSNQNTAPGDISKDETTLIYWADGNTTSIPSIKTKSDTTHIDTIQIKPIQNNARTSYSRVIIPRGAEYIVKLEDGSTIHLNAESELYIPIKFSRTNRNVRLKGGGYFNIVHDESSPFTVNINNMEIKVLGTIFDVKAYDDEPEVLATLVQGSIQISNHASKTILKPGMQACIKENGDIFIQEVNTNIYTAWADGRFVFEDETLETIMRETARWYDFQYTFEDPSIKNMRFTMNIIKNQHLSGFLQTFEELEKIKFETDGKTIKIQKK